MGRATGLGAFNGRSIRLEGLSRLGGRNSATESNHDAWTMKRSRRGSAYNRQKPDGGGQKEEGSYGCVRWMSKNKKHFCPMAAANIEEKGTCTQWTPEGILSGKQCRGTGRSEILFDEQQFANSSFGKVNINDKKR